MKQLIALIVCLMAPPAQAIDLALCPDLAEKFSGSMLDLEIREYDDLRICVVEVMAAKILARKPKPSVTRPLRTVKLEDGE